jgi:hypothetical protein
MTIRVIDEDIKHGVRRSSRRCAVALALQRAGLRDFTTAYGCVYVYENDHERVYRASFPREVETFMAKFDKGLKVEPFEFEIEVPA